MKVDASKYRDKGLKATPQRMAILKVLEGNTSHPSAEEIYREVLKDYPTVSFATVYNTLQVLKDSREVLELNIDRDKNRYDPNTNPHYHIICTECKKVEDIFTKEIIEPDIPSEIKRRFKITRLSIQFYGICRECQQREKEVRGKTAKS
ncbi:MAG: transcriptional repressor [Nitrospirota bacterium]